MNKTAIQTCLATIHPPQRIQLSRKSGWRKPKNTVSVARPTIWGNPFKADEGAAEGYSIAQAADDYEEWLLRGDGQDTLRKAKEELRGKDLACWCKPGSPCHGDVLLKLINT